MSTRYGSKAKFVASVAVFAGIAVYFTLLKLVVPYPILPYLRFEASEIPVITAFFIVGPTAAMSASVVYWMILTAVGEFSPIGPALKFAAVASTLLGLWAGIIFAKRFAKETNSLTMRMSSGIIVATISRVVVCSLTNYAVIWILIPAFLGLATGSIKAILAIDASSPLMAFTWIMLFTGIYNIIHIFVSILPAYAVTKTWSRVGAARLGTPWITEIAIKKSPALSKDPARSGRQ